MNKQILSKSTKWLALLVLLITAYFSEGYYHPDEHYQLLEFANYLNGGTTAENLPWEFHNQMRPTFQVYIASIVMKIVAYMNGSPFTVAFVLRILSALLSFVSIILLAKAFENKFENKIAGKALVLTSCFLWFIVFHHVRFSSENWSGTFFIIGFALYYIKSNKKILTPIIIGLMFGLAFLCRYQVIFMIGGFWLWILFFEEKKWRFIGASLTGFVLVALFGIALDGIYYQETTFSFYNYIYQNIFMDKASEFGVEPFWYYFTDSFIKAIPPFSIIYLAVFVYVIYKKPKSAVTWIIIPFLLVHCFIAHKETRFLVPVYYLIPLFIAFSVDELLKLKQSNFNFQKKLNLIVRLVVFLQVPMLLGIMIKPADITVGLYKALYTYPSKLSVYGFEKSPFDGNPPNSMNFYKRTDYEYHIIQSLNELEIGNDEKLFISRNNDFLMTAEKLEWTVVYQSLPKWLAHFNFNHWLERTPQWRVYKVP